MQSQHSRVSEALRRALLFLETHEATLDAATLAPSRRVLGDIVVQFDENGVTQDSSARGSVGETAKLRALRRRLRFGAMRPIVIVARQLLTDIPELRALRLPNRRVSSMLLIAAAGGMVDAVEPHAAALVEAGLPPDFIGRLRAAADELAGSIDGRNTFRRTRSGSTAALRSLERRGKAVLRVLDSLILTQLGAGDSLLAEWNVSRHIVKARRARSADDGGLESPGNPDRLVSIVA